MGDFTLTPADVGALRTLLARAKAAGWRNDGVERHEDGGDQEHAWGRGNDEIWFFGDDSTIDVEVAGEAWAIPALSVAKVATVLEAAGVLPPVDRTDLIRGAIADPSRYTERTVSPSCTYMDCTCESVSSWSARAVVIALGGAS